MKPKIQELLDLIKANPELPIIAKIAKVDGEEFGDCPLDFQTWKKLMGYWGNM